MRLTKPLQAMSRNRQHGSAANPRPASRQYSVAVLAEGEHEAISRPQEGERRDMHGRHRTEHRDMEARHKEERAGITDHESMGGMYIASMSTSTARCWAPSTCTSMNPRCCIAT